MRKRIAIFGLDHQVNVIVLNREVRDAHEASRVRRANGPLDGRKRPLPAKIPHVLRHPDGDVRRMTPAMVRPAAVDDVVGLRRLRSTGAGASPAPRTWRELQGQLALHHVALPHRRDHGAHAPAQEAPHADHGER